MARDEERKWFVRFTLGEGQRYSCDLDGWYYSGGLPEDPLGIVPDLMASWTSGLYDVGPSDGVPSVVAAERVVQAITGAKIERRKLPDAANERVKH